MNDVELKALELKRKAWAVLDAKTGPELLFGELYKMERQLPKFLEAVANQLEADNDRWSASSALPNVTIKRDKDGRVEEIAFHPVEDDNATSSFRTDNSNSETLKPTIVVWRSDHGDRMWIEDFAKDYNNEADS